MNDPSIRSGRFVVTSDVRSSDHVQNDVGSATRLLPVLQAEGLVTKTGRPFDKGAVYKLLVNRTYLGEAMHKGKSHPGEHAAIVPRAMWDAAHALLAISHHPLVDSFHVAEELLDDLVASFPVDLAYLAETR